MFVPSEENCICIYIYIFVLSKENIPIVVPVTALTVTTPASLRAPVLSLHLAQTHGHTHASTGLYAWIPRPGF